MKSKMARSCWSNSFINIKIENNGYIRFYQTIVVEQTPMEVFDAIASDSGAEAATVEEASRYKNFIIISIPRAIDAGLFELTRHTLLGAG